MNRDRENDRVTSTLCYSAADQMQIEQISGSLGRFCEVFQVPDHASML